MENGKASKRDAKPLTLDETREHSIHIRSLYRSKIRDKERLKKWSDRFYSRAGVFNEQELAEPQSSGGQWRGSPRSYVFLRSYLTFLSIQ